MTIKHSNNTRNKRSVERGYLSHCLSSRKSGNHIVNVCFIQDGFIHIAASGWISVNTEEKKNKHYIIHYTQAFYFVDLWHCQQLPYQVTLM